MSERIYPCGHPNCPNQGTAVTSPCPVCEPTARATGASVMASMSPTIGDVIARKGRQIDQLKARAEAAEARVRELEAAGSALIADVRRRYPGEDLICPFMRGLDAALKGDG